MTQDRLALLLVVVLVAASPAAVTSAAATRTTTGDCSTTAVHDAYRFNNETIETVQNQSVTTVASNTEVTVTDDTAFVRIAAQNPNGYCVEYHVELSSRVVAPAELGEVTSTDENTTASWHAVRDFENNTTYTEVVFTLKPGEQATFAPSKVRVKSLAWTGKAKGVLDGVFGNYSSLVPDFGLGSDAALKKRTYTFTPANNSSIVTVSLANKSDGRAVKDWQALYKIETKQGWSAWRPIPQESDAPVFYRKPDTRHVQFIFNQQDVKVRFTANPTRLEEAKHSWRAYTSGIEIAQDWLPNLFSSTAPPPQSVIP